MPAAITARWRIIIYGFGQIFPSRADSPATNSSGSSAHSLDSYVPDLVGSQSSWSLDSSGEPVIFVPVDHYDESAENLLSINLTQRVFLRQDGIYIVARLNKNNTFDKIIAETVEVLADGTHVHYPVDKITLANTPGFQEAIRTTTLPSGREQKHRATVDTTNSNCYFPGELGRKVVIDVNGEKKDYIIHIPKEGHNFVQYIHGDDYTNLGPAFGTNGKHCMDCRKKTRLQWNQGTCLCPVDPKK